MIHLAITYIDIILSNFTLPKPKLKPVSLICLSIASKFDELDDNIPLGREFIKFSGLKLKYQDFLQNEQQILK